MDTLCGLSFRLSVPTFYQVNREQAEQLYAVVRDYAGLTGRETVLDLYCGAGAIGLCLADAAGRVIGVETVPEAVADAKENARRNGIANAEFLCADAGDAKAQLDAGNIRPDLVIVDPPRKGLQPVVIDEIAGLSPERMVYVSCDPATQARDLKLLVQRGYEVKPAGAVDLFPRTSHVETVALLTRGR
jgi:23S rRNA (uracil1939-C5)-methyltransferase